MRDPIVAPSHSSFPSKRRQGGAPRLELVTTIPISLRAGRMWLSSGLEALRTRLDTADIFDQWSPSELKNTKFLLEPGEEALLNRARLLLGQPIKAVPLAKMPAGQRERWRAENPEGVVVDPDHPRRLWLKADAPDFARLARLYAEPEFRLLEQHPALPGQLVKPAPLNRTLTAALFCALDARGFYASQESEIATLMNAGPDAMSLAERFRAAASPAGRWDFELIHSPAEWRSWARALLGSEAGEVDPGVEDLAIDVDTSDDATLVQALRLLRHDRNSSLPFPD